MDYRDISFRGVLKKLLGHFCKPTKQAKRVLLGAERLEHRQMLTIVWANEFQAGNGFEAVYEENAPTRSCHC